MSDEKIDELIDKLTNATQIVYDVANNPYGTVTNEQGQVATVVKVMDDLKFFNPRGAWITGEDYLTKDTFTNGDNVYTALIDHESGVFATDLADGKIATYQNIDTTTQAQIAADDAAASAVSTAADVVTTNNNVTATNADVVTTGNNATTTNNNAIITNNNVTTTNSDATTTNNNVVITNNDVIATNADVVTTNINVSATNADVVTTNNNVTATNADVVSAGNSATAAAASAAAAALYDPTWEAWQTPSYETGWVGSSDPFLYRRSADGKLLQGKGRAASSSSATGSMATLPTGYEPSEFRSFIVRGPSATSNNMQIVGISDTGDIAILSWEEGTYYMDFIVALD